MTTAPTKSEIGRLIREQRESMPPREDGKRWTQARFGILLGVEGPTVYSWEAGSAFPSHTQLWALVEKAGMNPRILLLGSDPVDGDPEDVAA